MNGFAIRFRQKSCAQKIFSCKENLVLSRVRCVNYCAMFRGKTAAKFLTFSALMFLASVSFLENAGARNFTAENFSDSYQYNFGKFSLSIASREEHLFITHNHNTALEIFKYRLQQLKLKGGKSNLEQNYLEKAVQFHQKYIGLDKVLRLDLATNTTAGWDGLRAISNAELRRVVELRGVIPFIAAHRAALNRLIDKMEAKYGKINDHKILNYDVLNFEVQGFYVLAGLMGRAYKDKDNRTSYSSLAPETADDKNLFLESWKNEHKPLPDLVSDRVRATSKEPLVIVHPSREFDQLEVASAGLDKLIAKKKLSHNQVIVLTRDDYSPSEIYLADRNPDFHVYSDGGENSIALTSNTVTLAGGFFSSSEAGPGCMVNGLSHIASYALKQFNEFNVELYLPAIYFHDNKYGDFIKGDRGVELASLARRNPSEFMREIGLGNLLLPRGVNDPLDIENPQKNLDRSQAKNWVLGYSDLNPSVWDLSQITIAFYVDGNWIGSMGYGPKRLNLRFLTEITL